MPYEIVSPEFEIRQGDIFRFGELESLPFSARHAIILTADCDIAQEKSYEQLLLCPLIEANQYIGRFWANKKMASCKDQIVQKTKKLLSQISPAGSTSPISPTEDAIIDLLSDDGAIDKFIESYSTSIPAPNKTDLCNCRDAFKCLSNVGHTPLEAICNMEATFKSIPQDKAKAAIQSEIRNALGKQISSDAFFLPSISEELTQPFVALLRFPFSRPDRDMTTSIKEYRTKQFAGVRISRLSSVLKYALSQKFGYLFSRIGLPEEIEIKQKTAIQNMEIPL